MSNPYPATFQRHLATLDGMALALDCGSGPRKHPDGRVLSLDGDPHRHVDVVSDVTAMPFPDGTFDLVLSQAVLEHVVDPQAVVDEMVRVLAPGGLLYIEVPQMQPWHPVPVHHQNFTAQGLAHLCRGLEPVDSGAFGGLAVSVEWLGREAGAPAVLGSQMWAAILDALADVDDAMTPAQLERVAYAVCGTWRKP